MSSFLPTAQTALPLASASRTASATSLQPTTTSEATYWKKYRNPQFLAIPSNYPANDLSFATDNKYAVAAGPRVGVYSTKLGNVSDVLNENKKRVHDDFDDVGKQRRDDSSRDDAVALLHTTLTLTLTLLRLRQRSRGCRGQEVPADYPLHLVPLRRPLHRLPRRQRHAPHRRAARAPQDCR